MTVINLLLALAEQNYELDRLQSPIFCKTVVIECFVLQRTS